MSKLIKNLSPLFDKGPNWIEKSTLYLTIFGSHAYGTNIEGSDVDVKGIAIPPKEYFLGYSKKFEQFENKELDVVVYDIRKFFKLAADCNPSIIEVLYTEPEDHILLNPLGGRILQLRNQFLSKKAKHTFSGYAISQLKRINLHRRYILNPPKEFPTRQSMGLPERTLIPKDHLEAARAAIQKKIDSWGLDLDNVDKADRVKILNGINDVLTDIKVNTDNAWIGAARSIGFSDNFIELLDKERQYENKKKDWDSYNDWKKNRNQKRAETEVKFKYDTKHASHLVRLMRMCKEIVEKGQVIVKRPDKEELIEIRNGKWSYEQVPEFANKIDNELDISLKKSKLPEKPDHNLLDRELLLIVEEFFKYQ